MSSQTRSDPAPGTEQESAEDERSLLPESAWDSYREGSTPLIGGQAQRLLPFTLRLTDSSQREGGLLSFRAMQGGVSLLVSRDQLSLERLSVPDRTFASIEIRGRPEFRAQDAASAQVALPGGRPGPGRAAMIADAGTLGRYLEAWLDNPESARCQLIEAEPGLLAGEASTSLMSEVLVAAERFGLPLLAPTLLEADPHVLALLSPGLARRMRALPLIERAGALAVVVADPAREGLLNQLEFATGRRIALLLAQPLAVERAISRSYDRVEDQQLLQALGLTGGAERESAQTQREVERLAAEQPIVRLVHELFEGASRRRASDIHIRPGINRFEVLYRIDGRLQLVRAMDRALLAAVVSRIKVLAGMNIAERRLPQDGRIAFSVGDRLIDMRISVLPTVDGESVVVRLLDTLQALRNLDGLGLAASDTLRLRDLLARSHGMVLVTGPTGSGKSTTLYAALNHVRSDAINVVTVENPVEYHIAGIMQVQVHEAIGYTFAKTLRNILRHDPDVIMVGEIRDQETARIATEAALTGHLLLSTLHTNSAASTITRLLDLGVESFLLRSTLLGVLAQRLARRNCPHCLAPEKHDPHVAEQMGANADETFFRSSGCARCEGSGVAGRVAVYELMPVDAGLRRLIEPHADAEGIHQYAVRHGMRTISQNALELARHGTITLAEAFRIHVD